MKKPDLFINSFKHLNVTVTETVTTPPSVQKRTEEKEEITPPLKKNPNWIYLGKGEVYTDSEQAYSALLNSPGKEEFPAKYRNSLTKAFFNGTEAGQINTLFKDFKKYREKIIPKIAEFFVYIRSSADKCPLLKRYAEHVIAALKPDNEETYEEGAVDLKFFKFWVLFKFFVAQKGKANS